MSVGRGLIVELREVDAAQYGNTYSQGVEGAELDVDRISKRLGEGGFGRISTLKTGQATATAILDGLRRGTCETQPDDLFVYYCAGHGNQQDDDPTSPDEEDFKDETFYEYDRKIIDDEFGAIWRKFRPGARIVMVTDCCFSGTLYKLLGDEMAGPSTAAATANADSMDARLLSLASVAEDRRSIGYEGGGLFTIELFRARGKRGDSRVPTSNCS